MYACKCVCMRERGKEKCFSFICGYCKVCILFGAICETVKWNGE